MDKRKRKKRLLCSFRISGDMFHHRRVGFIILCMTVFLGEKAHKKYANLEVNFGEGVSSDLDIISKP